MCGNDTLWRLKYHNLGYNVFTGDSANPNGIVRTWSNLISHYSVRIQATVYKIDSWTNSTFFAMVDGTSAALYTWNSSNGGTVDICGNPSPFIDSVNTNYNELITNINVTVPHSSSSLTVNFTSNLPNNLGFWGIKNIIITLQACDYSCNTCTDGSKMILWLSFLHKLQYGKWTNSFRNSL